MQSEVITQAAADQLDTAPLPETPLPKRGAPGLPIWARILLGNRLALAGLLVFTVIFLAAIFAPMLTRFAPETMTDAALGSSPSPTHWFGTNDQGQDIFAQVLYGARFSLAVGFGTGFSIAAVATLVGMIAGYARSWLDDILTLVMNIFLIIPQLPLLIVIGAYVPLKGNSAVGAVLLMVGVITVTGWAWGARVIRAQTLSLRSRDFVQAALVVGESTWRIIFVEMLPNMTSLIVNTVILSTMGGILTEAGLDYLGIGNINQITWGTMLYHAQSGSALFIGEWWVFVFPGLAIALTVMSMILINNGVDAISNPRLRTLGRRRKVRLVRARVPSEMVDAEATS